MPILPLVSVIIPTYNAGQYIIETLQSVLKQDYPNIEIIIVDDGSTDDTLEQINQLSFPCPIKIIRQLNMGPAAARNRGTMQAQGEFLAFIDADDVWLDNKLSAQMDYLLTNPDVGIVHGRFLRWYPKDGVFDSYPTDYQEQNLDPDLYKDGCIYPNLILYPEVHIITTIVRKSIWQKLDGFDEKLRIGEDYDFFIRASRHTKIIKLNQLTAYYRKHTQSTTMVVPVKNYEYQVVKNALKRFGIIGTDGRKIPQNKLNHRLHRLCFDYGYLHFWQGDIEIALQSFQQAYIHRKNHLKTAIYWLLAYSKSFMARCNAWILKINKKYDVSLKSKL